MSLTLGKPLRECQEKEEYPSTLPLFFPSAKEFYFSSGNLSNRNNEKNISNPRRRASGKKRKPRR